MSKPRHEEGNNLLNISGRRQRQETNPDNPLGYMLSPGYTTLHFYTDLKQQHS